MDSIRIKNLHCLKDTGLFDLKEINLLVGANSSGKSTFLRTFPLLKQGLNTNKKGPILWLSQDVDFGDFKEAVTKGESSIEFDFTFGRFHLNFHIKNISNIDYIDYISISFHDQKIEFILNSKGLEKLLINDENLYTEDLHIKYLQSRGSILPEFLTRIEDDSLDENTKRYSYFTRRNPLFDNMLIGLINEIVWNKLSQNTIRGIKDNISTINSREGILNQCKKIARPKKWKDAVELWDINNKDFLKLNNHIILTHSLRLLSHLNERLSRSLLETSYIGPIRATAERYYRRQNLALDFIDSAGINLPMFINDLSNSEFNDLREWLLTNFDFTLRTEYSGGHISISLIDEKTKDSFNLADSGFGFSQILPIIVSIWLFQRKRNYRTHNKSSCLVIEQPELHLHPALQAKLADVFIKTILYTKENNLNFRLILETHSETIINRIGAHIANGVLDKDMVSIGLFTKSPSDKEKNVTFAKYTQEGYLENWPIGFFDIF